MCRFSQQTGCSVFDPLGINVGADSGFSAVLKSITEYFSTNYESAYETKKERTSTRGVAGLTRSMSLFATVALAAFCI